MSGRVSAKGWRFALASVVGTSHQERAQPCQDWSACRVLSASSRGNVLVAVAADGAGSARRAEVGAVLTGSLFLDELATHYASGGSVRDLSHAFVGDWLSRLRQEIRTHAESEGLTVREYASTLVAAVVEEASAAFLQIGDGAIVVADQHTPAAYAPVFWPQRGEYANTTYFATDANAADHVEFRRVDDRIDELALLTDGLQSLALNYQAQAAHAPFFRPVFAPVRAAPPGHSIDLSTALASFLGSSRVNARTDDDKTLLLASRRRRDRQRSPRAEVPRPDTSRA